MSAIYRQDENSYAWNSLLCYGVRLIMRQFIRRAGVYIWHAFICLSVLAAMLALVWAAVYLLSVHHRLRAERLIQNLASLDFAHPEPSALARLSRATGVAPKCAGDVCSYQFKEDFGLSSYGPIRLLRRTEWDYVGVRPWRFTLQVKTQKGGITNAEYFVMVGRGRGWLYHEGLLSGSMWAWLAASARSSAVGFNELVKIEKERLSSEAWAGSAGIIIQKPNMTVEGGGEALFATFSPDAPLESRRIAFDINLRCTTAMSPCTEICQLFPSAWESHARFQKSRGFYVEEPGVCPPLTLPAAETR
jgi:hypothetical protein